MDTRIFSEDELFSLLTGCFEYMDIMETTGVEPLDYMEMLDIHTIHAFYAMPAEEQAHFRDLVMQIVRDNKGAFEKLRVLSQSCSPQLSGSLQMIWRDGRMKVCRTAVLVSHTGRMR